MKAPTQEQLLNYIAASLDFYERVKGPGSAPTDKQIQALLAACGVYVPFERIEAHRDSVDELEEEVSE